MYPKIRQRLALCLLLMVPLGIGTKLYAGPAAEWIRAHGGGLLYVIFWTAVVSLLAPSLSPWKAAGGVFFVTCGLEFLQLWRPPILQAVRETFVGRALIGSTFDGGDFLHYGLGALLGALLVMSVRRTSADE